MKRKEGLRMRVRRRGFARERARVEGGRTWDVEIRDAPWDVLGKRPLLDALHFAALDPVPASRVV